MIQAEISAESAPTIARAGSKPELVMNQAIDPIKAMMDSILM
jgi:hypothetical protein